MRGKCVWKTTVKSSAERLKGSDVCFTRPSVSLKRICKNLVCKIWVSLINLFIFLIKTLDTYVKYLNLDLRINIWKDKQGKEKRKRFKLNGRFQNWKQICEAFIRCIEAVFYKPDFQTFLMCSLIKILGWAFISKHAVEPLEHLADLLKHSGKLLKS